MKRTLALTVATCVAAAALTGCAKDSETEKKPAVASSTPAQDGSLSAPPTATAPTETTAPTPTDAGSTPPAPTPAPPNTGKESKYSRTLELVSATFVAANSSPELAEAKPTDAAGTNTAMGIGESSSAWFSVFDTANRQTCLLTEEGTYFAFMGKAVDNGEAVIVMIGDGECSFRARDAVVVGVISPGRLDNKWSKGGALMSTYNPADILDPAKIAGQS